MEKKVNVQKKSKRGEALFVPRLVNVRMSSSESEGSRFLREAARAIPLVDLYQAQAREARRQMQRDGPLLDADDSESDDEAKAADDNLVAPDNDADVGAANSETTEQTRVALGPFQMPPDMELVSLPEGSDTQAGWEREARAKKFWSGKRLAHIFDDEWSTGTYQKAEILNGKLHFAFHYKDLKMKYSHGLLLEEHGLLKSWVVIQKAN